MSWSGIILVVVGALLLANNFGLLPLDWLRHWWPLILIVIGLMSILRPHTAGAARAGRRPRGAGDDDGHEIRRRSHHRRRRRQRRQRLHELSPREVHPVRRPERRRRRPRRQRLRGRRPKHQHADRLPLRAPPRSAGAARTGAARTSMARPPKTSSCACRSAPSSRDAETGEQIAELSSPTRRCCSPRAATAASATCTSRPAPIARRARRRPAGRASIEAAARAARARGRGAARHAQRRQVDADPRDLRARPKIADYPFTTLRRSSASCASRASGASSSPTFPGLIEGAAEGAGLGHQFLRHLQRTRLLLHLVDFAPLDGRRPGRAGARHRRAS